MSEKKEEKLPKYEAMLFGKRATVDPNKHPTDSSHITYHDKPRKAFRERFSG